MPSHSAKIQKHRQEQRITQPAPRLSLVRVHAPPAKRGIRRWQVLISAALLAGIAIGVAIHESRYSSLPPLRAWEKPESATPAGALEARLSAAALAAPGDAAAWTALGRFHLGQGQPFEALWSLREAMQLDPRALQPRLALAAALTAAQFYRPALQTLQEAIRAHPEDSEGPRQLAILLLSLGRSEDAAAAMATAEQRTKLSNEERLLLARSLEATGRDQEALEQYERCRQAEPVPGDAFFRLVRLLIRSGRTAAARQLLTTTRVPDSRQSERLYDLGLTELKQGPTHEALARDYFARSLDQNDQFVPAHVQFGFLFQRHGERDRAVTAFSRAAELDPHNYEAVLQLSRLRRAMGDEAGAAYYQGVYADLTDARPEALLRYQAMAAAQHDPRGPLLVSAAAIKMDRQNEAANIAREGLRRYPANTELMERLIACDLLTGNLEEPAHICRDWLRRAPASSRPAWFLGRTRLALHDRAGALLWLQRAARTEPKNAEYQFAIGSIYADQPSRENWEIAARYYGQAVTLQPDDARYRQNLGIALQNIGRLEGARRQFLRSMDLDVNQSAPLNNVVQVARGLKKFDQVEFWAPLVREVEQRLREELPDWKRVWDHPQDPAGYLPLAEFLQRTGELRKARNILEQSVALKPDAATRRRLAILQRTLDVL